MLQARTQQRGAWERGAWERELPAVRLVGLAIARGWARPAARARGWTGPGIRGSRPGALMGLTPEEKAERQRRLVREGVRRLRAERVARGLTINGTRRKRAYRFYATEEERREARRGQKREWARGRRERRRRHRDVVRDWRARNH